MINIVLIINTMIGVLLAITVYCVGSAVIDFVCGLFQIAKRKIKEEEKNKEDQ